MFPNRTYSDAEKLQVYREMIRRARKVPSQPVVFDATFFRRDIRSMFHEAFPDMHWIEVRADAGVIRQRLSTPRADSEADLGVHHLIRSQWEPLEGDFLTLPSTSANVDEMLDRAIEYLGHDR